MVEEAEDDANQVGIFDGIEEFLSKCKKVYNTLSDEEKARLDSRNCLSEVEKLIAGSAKVGTVAEHAMNMADIGSAAASAIGEVAGSGPWWEAIQGINIVIKSAFMVVDVKEFMELHKMRNDWYAGGERRVDLLKNPKFEKEIKLRDNIRDIRDNIMKHGF